MLRGKAIAENLSFGLKASDELLGRVSAAFQWWQR